MKTVGAAMVLVGMVGLAWRAVGRLGERAELLRSLQGALAYMEEELAFRFTPLPKLLEHLAQSRQGAAGAFFQKVLREMDREEDVSLRQSWTRAAEDTLPLLKDPGGRRWQSWGRCWGSTTPRPRPRRSIWPGSGWRRHMRRPRRTAGGWGRCI